MERWRRRVRRGWMRLLRGRVAEDGGATGAGWGDWGEFLRFLDKGLGATREDVALRTESLTQGWREGKWGCGWKARHCAG